MSIAAPIITFKAGICDLDVRINNCLQSHPHELSKQQTLTPVASRPLPALPKLSQNQLQDIFISTPKMISFISAGDLGLLHLRILSWT